MTTSAHAVNFDSCKNFYSLADFERVAKRKLPVCVFEYVRGGAEDELALNENRLVFDRPGFRLRGLRNVSHRNTPDF